MIDRLKDKEQMEPNNEVHLIKERIKLLIKKIESKHQTRVFLAKEYTKADLIEELRALIEPG